MIETKPYHEFKQIADELDVRLSNEPITNHDLFLGVRGGQIRLLTCRTADQSRVYPVEAEFPYDRTSCYKIVE